MSGVRASIEMAVDGAAESRRDIERVGDALRGMNNESLSLIGSQVGDLDKRIGGLSGTLGDLAKFATAGVSLAWFGAMIKSAADTADNLNDLSKVTGITVENLSGLQLAAQQSGTDLAGIADSIKELSVNMAGDAERFAKLGVTAKDPLEAFKQLSDVFVSIDEPQMRAAFGAAALGDSWAVAAPLLAEGSGKIGEMVEKGILLSATTQQMAEKADEFNDRLTELGAAVDGAKMSLAKEMLPALTEVASTISFTLQESGKLEAAWVGLGALGAFAFTDHFSSAEVKIKNLREELAEVQTDLELSKNAPYVGYVGRMLFGETTDVLENRVAEINRQIESLQRLQNAPVKPVLPPGGSKDGQGESSIAAQVAEFLKLSEARNKAASVSKSQANAYQNLTQSIQKKIAQSNIELRYGASLTTSQQVQLELTEQLAAVKGKLGPMQEAHVEMLIKELVTNLEVIESNKRAEEGMKSWGKTRADFAAATARTIQDALSEADRNEELARTFGKTRSEIEALNLARLEDQYARRTSSEMDLEDIANLEKLIAAKKRSSAALSSVETMEAGRKAAESLDQFLDPAKAQTFGEALRESLGGAGTALSALTASLDGFGKRQAEIDEQRKNAALALATGQRTEMQNLQDLARLNEMEAKNRMQGYGDMAGAAAGFFGEQSRGYQTLMTVSKVFHAAELAMTMAELVPKGIAAVLNQGSGDPYTAFGRMAAMAAVVAGLGVAIGGVSGGSGMSLSESRQKAQGTGTVLGSDAKSDSIARALSQIEQSTQDNLGVSNEMLISLRNIESGIGQFASLLVRTTGVTGDFGSEYNKNVFDAKSIGIGGALGGGVVGAMGGAYVGMGTSQIGMLLGGPVGMALGAALGAVIGKTFIGKALGSVFGGKQTVEDTGFTFDPTNFSSIAAGSLAAMQYADIKKDGGWFRSDKISTQTAPLGAEGNRQITGVLLSLYDTVYEAGQIFGLGADSFNAQLSQFVVDIGKVSLKGKTDDEIQKELSAVFSKVGDNLAAFGVAGLEQFQQVGEGYLETLARVASNYAGLDAIMASIGRTVGAAGIDSLAARERLISLSGGISALAGQASTFAQEFLTEAERLAPVQKHVVGQLADMGLAWVDTRDEFKSVILGLNLTTEAGAKQYTSLMSLAEAFAQVYPATQDLTKSMQEIADERKSLQDRLDEMTMTREQLLAKERATIHESNLPLWDRIQSLQAEASAAEAATAAAQAAQQVAAGLMGNVDSAFSVLQRVVEREKAALQSQIANHTEAANKIRAVSNSLRSTIDGMRGPGAEAIERARAQSDLRSFLALARAGGVLPDADKLQAVLSTLTQDASDQFASFADYQADFYRTRNDMSDLAAISDKALTVEERTLDTLEDQLASYDKMLEREQEQIDQLKGIATTGLSIRDAILALQSAILGAKANPINAAVSSISEAYQSALGRAPDAAGLEYWKGSAAAGNSISDIVNSISNSPEAQIRDLYKSTFGRTADAAGLQYWMDRAAAGVSYDAIAQSFKESNEYKGKIPGYAAGGDHTGGWRIVGENGPELEATGPARIFNAGQTRDLMARLGSPADNSAALTAEVRALRQEVAALRESNSRENLAIAKQARNGTDLLDRWEAIGLPKERVN